MVGDTMKGKLPAENYKDGAYTAIAASRKAMFITLIGKFLKSTATCSLLKQLYARGEKYREEDRKLTV